MGEFSSSYNNIHYAVFATVLHKHTEIKRLREDYILYREGWKKINFCKVRNHASERGLTLK